MTRPPASDRDRIVRPRTRSVDAAPSAPQKPRTDPFDRLTGQLLRRLRNGVLPLFLRNVACGEGLLYCCLQSLVGSQFIGGSLRGSGELLDNAGIMTHLLFGDDQCLCGYNSPPLPPAREDQGAQREHQHRQPGTRGNFMPLRANAVPRCLRGIGWSRLIDHRPVFPFWIDSLIAKREG